MKEKFIDYPKEYENYYLSKERLEKFDLSKAQTSFEGGWDKYEKFFNNFMREMDVSFYNYILRYYWLQRKFFYGGFRKREISNNHWSVEHVYALFQRFKNGINHMVLIKSFYFAKVVSYVVDFYPEFDKKDPFKEPEYYKFPYKNITCDFLTVVYQMSERLELLKIAEERKMNVLEFYDYLLNYTNIYNDKHNDNVYTFMWTDSLVPPYIRDNKSKNNKKYDKVNGIKR